MATEFHYEYGRESNQGHRPALTGAMTDAKISFLEYTCCKYRYECCMTNVKAVCYNHDHTVYLAQNFNLTYASSVS